MFVISASAMRSGSSWYLNLTNDLLNLKNKKAVRQIRQTYDLQDVIVNDFVDVGKLQYRKLLRLFGVSLRTGAFAVKTHKNPTRGTRVFTHLGMIRSTYIYRDPRDRIVSLLEMAERARQAGETGGPFAPLHTFADALALIKDAYPHYQRWSRHPRTLVVQYEKLVQQPLDEMQRLAVHLGIDARPEDLDAILAAYDRDALKPDAKYTNYQKGKIGRYRDVLTAAQIAQLEETLGDDLLQLGYQPTASG